MLYYGTNAKEAAEAHLALIILDNSYVSKREKTNECKLFTMK
jgi:hypothetical protein